MTLSRQAIEREVQAGKLARVFVNQTDVGVVTRGDWDAAMALITDYAVDEYGGELRSLCNNTVQLGALSLDRLAAEQGGESGTHFPMLGADNSREQELPAGGYAMVVFVGGAR